MSTLPISSDTAGVSAAQLTSVRSSVPLQQNQVAGNSLTVDAITATNQPARSDNNSQPGEPRFTSPADIAQALDEVQSAIKNIANELHFSIDDDTGKTVVKIVDMATNEVIRQFPSEELLRISKALDKFQGLLLQQEA